MKKTSALFTSLVLIISLFTSTSFASLSFDRIVVFGDSLSDQGTYAVFAKPKGGGKFTTNPGKLWIEVVADKMNLPITANRHEGFGFPTHILGGLNFAQGGARISNTIGIDATGYSGRPVTEQINYFIQGQKNFKANDIVFILAGANDAFAFLKQVGDNDMTPQQAVGLMAQTATELAVQVQRLNDLGAQHVVVLNLPMMQSTPRALEFDAQTRTLIMMMVKTFNQTLQTQLAQNSTAYLVDFYSFDENFSAHYQDYGFENITSPACTEHVWAHSSLFCSAANLIKPGADLTYKFADSIHPATGFSKIAGEFVFSEIQKITTPSTILK